MRDSCAKRRRKRKQKKTKNAATNNIFLHCYCCNVTRPLLCSSVFFFSSFNLFCWQPASSEASCIRFHFTPKACPSNFLSILKDIFSLFSLFHHNKWPMVIKADYSLQLFPLLLTLTESMKQSSNLIQIDRDKVREYFSSLK